MFKDEYIAALRLQKIPFIGDITAKKLVSHCGSPSAVFNDKWDSLSRIEGVGEFILRGLKNKNYLHEALVEYEFIEQNKIKCQLFTEQNYPELLKHCIDGPILLFSKGEINLRDKKIVSVVGTRNMTSYGRQFCENLVDELAALDPVIVSGFALGVDICVQKEAICSHVAGSYN